jgi:outer membrane protein OmpA-like peptidoglycan-associated protein
MQRVSVAVLLALVGVIALSSVGCVDQQKYDSLLLRNREQEKLIQEKEAQLAGLNERVTALTARAQDAQNALSAKDDHLASVSRERDEVRRAFNQLLDAYKKLSDRPPPVGPAGIAKEVVIEIRQLADQYPGVFVFDEATGTLRFAADITFDSGSNAVKADAKAALTKLGVILTADVAKNIRVAVKGHTDTDRVVKPATTALLKELNKSATNQGLSEARAESVADILMTAKVERGRITTTGAGDLQPIADNKTAEGKAKNRRVEIILSGS